MAPTFGRTNPKKARRGASGDTIKCSDGRASSAPRAPVHATQPAAGAAGVAAASPSRRGGERARRGGAQPRATLPAAGLAAGLFFLGGAIAIGGAMLYQRMCPDRCAYTAAPTKTGGISMNPTKLGHNKKQNSAWLDKHATETAI